MLVSDAGDLCVMHPAVKEVLMGFPPRYTHTVDVPNGDQRTLFDNARHKMIANTWHVGVARAVLYAFLVLGLVPQVS